jgi:hypothetical protein
MTGKGQVMLGVHPETRGRVKKRKGDRSYDEYIQHLLEVEDEHEATG